MQTHYEVLGIPPTASEEDIRAAYRQRARETHPDAAGTEHMEEFLRVKEAYEVLTNPERKVHYDRLIKLDQQISDQKNASASAPTGSGEKIRTWDDGQLRRLIKERRWDRAETLASELLGRDPNYAYAYAALATIAQYRGDLQQSIRLYGRAYELDPMTRAYQTSQEEVMQKARAAGKPAASADSKASPREAKVEVDVAGGGGSVAATAIAGGVLILMLAYLILADESPFFGDTRYLSTITLGFLGMSLLGGITIGAAFTAGRLVEPWGSPDAETGMPPILLGGIAVVNFWIAAVAFVLVNLAQQRPSVTLSRLIAGNAAWAFVLSGVWFFKMNLNGFGQGLLWAGNLAFIGVLAGWFLTSNVIRAND